MKLSNAIYLRILELAKKHGLSVYALAQKSGVPRSTISTMTASKSVGTATVYGICEGLEITLEEFFHSPLFKRENIYD